MRKFISTFWNKRLYVTVFLVISCIVGIIYTNEFVRPKYQAYTTFILEKNAEQGSEANSSLNLDDKNVIGTYAELVQSNNILRKTINNLKINENEESLKSKINVCDIKGSQVVKIVVVDESPVNAMNIANEVTNVFSTTVSELCKGYNIHIIDSADQPILPCNINHFRDIVIFVLVGFLVSIIYVFVIVLFDNTVKSANDIESSTELITIASIPFDDQKRGGIN